MYAVEDDLNEQEVKDLEKLFRKVANIFKQYVGGQDEEALAKTAKLAERFGHCHCSQVWTSVWAQLPRVGRLRRLR